MVVVGCGKKGPPLPPLVKLPSAPANFSAERRGGRVDLQFEVPAANTDNSRPANIARVEVYAMTSAQPVAEDQIIKEGTRVATVAVKAPKNPNDTIAEDESPADMATPEGAGLDQGALAHASETLTAEALTPVAPKRDKSSNREPALEPFGPLLPPSETPLVRAYVAVGVSSRDRKGAPSRRLPVPLIPPPPAPSTPQVTYDEKAIAITWRPVAGAARIQPPAAAGELDSRPIGPPAPATVYTVYDAKTNARLTSAPVTEPLFSDPRIVWGEERCYTIRAQRATGDLKIESDAPPPACATLVDTFAPAPPANLYSSPAAGAISLIWDANREPDLAGYIVLRGSSVETLAPLFNDVMTETTFRDTVQPGVRFTYAVIAVDRAGNRSAPSKPVEEAARE